MGVLFKKSSGLMMCSDSIVILKVLGKPKVAFLRVGMGVRLLGVVDFFDNGLRDSLRLRLMLWLKQVECFS